MGSRIMHLLAADMAAEKLKIRDKASFLLGGIAPDAVSPKVLSHFYTGNAEDFSRSIDYEAFLEKYRHTSNHAYILGYYAHLIADDLWLKGFYLPWLRNRLEKDEGILKLYHGDFGLLNGKLLAVYGSSSLASILKNENREMPDLEEVPSSAVPVFIPHCLADMEYGEDALAVPLKVFTFDQIAGYVETAAELACLKIEQAAARLGEAADLFAV
ncbi:zinc dependent phospholipase C family protein [Bacillus infantis]|uniref:zinc dependent phospholipase C family protein n=1 Tax=Bacillus infantis TaxID=324767 RepID=UPI001CD7339F|nr:zinc dependent phospholipase C family protein [Bacillus infantis]MCA1039387.1 zinc dependent phospholipase C family protein [Bacillus infantis]